MKVHFLTLLFVASIAVNAQAKPTNKKAAPQAAPLVQPHYMYADEVAYERVLKDSKKPRRSVARVDVPALEASFSKEFIDLRAALIGAEAKPGFSKATSGVTNPEQLESLINQYSNIDVYNKLDAQSKLVALQLRALKPYKSFIFRARNYIGKNSATRTMIVTMLRAQLAGVQTFFPLSGNANVNHWEVVFKYVTEPQKGMGPAINTDKDLYSFLAHVTNEAQVVINDFSALVAEGKDIWWDNKLYFSFANFSSEKDRYVKLGDAELKSIYSSLALNISGLYATTAYSLDGLQTYVRHSGQLFGIDGIDDITRAVINVNGADGMSSKSRFALLKSYPNLFILQADGAMRMSVAYYYLQDGVRAAKESYNLTQSRGNSESDYLFDGRAANAVTRTATTSIDQLDQLFAAKDVGSTVVNGERIKVSLQNFYNKPPQSLSELYPQRWEEGAREINVVAWGKADKLRNYKFGMAKEWNLAPYQKLFPEIQATANNPQRTTEVGRYARILSQTWGASAFAIPLSAVIF